MKHPQRQLKDWWRVLRVLLYLVIRPQDIPNYWRYGAFTQKTPLELEMPWWSFGAVKYVSTRLQANHNVFEFGSGGSTIFVGSRVRSLTAVEDEKEWIDLVSEAAKRKHLDGVTIHHRPFNFWKTEQFGGSDYLLSLSGRYDVIIVDGKEQSEPVRDQCFWRAEDHIKPGGIIVVDDSWRYPQVKRRNRAVRWKEYRGLGFCRVGVTSTCIFEY